MAKKSVKRSKAPASTSRGFGAAKGSKVANPSRPETAEEASWRAFQDWLTTQGCVCDAVELYEESGLRGIRATRDLKVGDEVLRVPRSIILDEAMAAEGPVGALWRGVPEVELPAYAKIALQVLYEQRLGTQSHVAPYIALLPTPSQLSGYAPAATWKDEELALTECGKLVGDAQRLRRLQRDGDGHPALEPAALAEKWRELSFPGQPPTPEDVAWAVTVVTSRAYGAEDPSRGGTRLSLLLPMVDMANHVHPPPTVKGLEEDGQSFVVLAKTAIKRSEQVFLTYGGLPNFMLLLQFGFVLPGAASDLGLVDCTSLVGTGLEAGGERAEALRAVAAEGLLMREGPDASNWQPAGPQLAAALTALAEAGALPGHLVEAADETSSEAAGALAYTNLLRQTLAGYSTSIQDDREALKAEDLPPRSRLAIEFRLSQKTLLNQALGTAGGAARSRRSRASGLPDLDVD